MKNYDREVRVVSSVFEPIFLGDKTSYITVNSYKVGDILRLLEFSADDLRCTGRECDVEVTYVDQFTDGLALLSITLVA